MGAEGLGLGVETKVSVCRARFKSDALSAHLGI